MEVNSGPGEESLKSVYEEIWEDGGTVSPSLSK